LFVRRHHTIDQLDGRRLLPLLLLPALLACGETRSQPDGGSSERAIASTPVMDDAGRVLHLAAPPTRIVSLIPATTELLVALGATDRLVARTDFDRDPTLAALPSVGPGLTPSIEWLVSLRPELVIAWPDSRDRGLTAQLESLGIPTYSALIESLDDIVSTTRHLGALLGLAPGADSLVQAIEEGFAEVRRAVAGRDRPAVFYVVGHEPPMTAGPGTFLDELIDLAGGRNLFTDTPGWPQVSLEEVVRRQPELLIVPFGEGNERVEGLMRRPGWRELDAVRAGRIYSIDAEIAHRPGPRITEVARMLAEMIHPEAFPAVPAR
jgi:iron complex transport system substrate-binding protein